jgi:hypothetical protein
MKPRKNKPGQVEQTSSPAKVFHSRASKPSAISAVGTQTPAVDQSTTNANIAALQAKLDALIAALKK